jgi:vacuolar-type H+-ATPase subunit I/STV1
MTLQTILTSISIAIGLAGVIGILAAMFFGKRNETMVRFLQDEVKARKDQVERMEHERNEYREKLHVEVQRSQALTLRNTELEQKTDMSVVTLTMGKIIEAVDKTNARLDIQATEHLKVAREQNEVCGAMGDAFRELVAEIRESRAANQT